MNSFNSPLEAFLYWEKSTPKNPFLKQFSGDQIITYSYKSAGEEIRSFAAALNGYNLPEKSHIAILSKNCAHWILADLAIMMAGHVSIPVDSTLNAESINQILVHSESKIVILGPLDHYESQKKGIPAIIKINIGQSAESEGHTWEELVTKNPPLLKIRQQKKDDLLTIIYTSGTTKKPKGVMHSAGNIMEVANSFKNDIIPHLNSTLPKNPKNFSYLPFTHISERVSTVGSFLLLGGVTYIPESNQTFLKNIKVAKPHIFGSVPTVWIKYHEQILESISQKKLDTVLKTPVIGPYIKRKIIRRMGFSDTIYFICGSANLSVDLIKWFQKLGVEIHQAYGTTEDMALSHFNLPGANKIGTVGKALPNIKIKLIEQGEILIKNNCLMMGYFKDPELSKNAFDANGYFKTGDIGRYDKQGYLTVIGRKKTQFKTDNGKYVSPEYIESKLVQNINIEQACVVGENLPKPIAIVNLSDTGKRKVKQQVAESIYKTLFVMNDALEKHEKIQKVIITKDTWTVDNMLLTPTLKIKRLHIESVYKANYKSWYNNKEEIIFEDQIT